MNISDVLSPRRHLAFRGWRRVVTALPARRFHAFGDAADQINAVVVINLDRQPARRRRIESELARFETLAGDPLTSVTRRSEAVDARDGRAVAATADVDVTYRMAHQLFVQPDPRLEESFGAQQLVRMTKQEVAVARSHIEVWKTVATGSDTSVLVLEDDVWFRVGARAAIDQSWRDAVEHSRDRRGPQFLYLSHALADPAAPRERLTRHLFRPTRGLWYLSGYVLSREGAATLLRAMPVVGPVDLWINQQLAALDAFAMTRPALPQRPDTTSGNSYSILPFLARAGVVDAGRELRQPRGMRPASVVGWTRRGQRDSLSMALSMLGLRVCAFDGDEAPLDAVGLRRALETFDAVIDPPLDQLALTALWADPGLVVVAEDGATLPDGSDPAEVARPRDVTVLHRDEPEWVVLCEKLGLDVPVDPYPVGVPRSYRAFRNSRPVVVLAAAADGSTYRGSVHDGAAAGAEQRSSRTRPSSQVVGRESMFDDTPWVLPAQCGWAPTAPTTAPATAPTGAQTSARTQRAGGTRVTRLSAPLTHPTPALRALSETFPGNLAVFGEDNLAYRTDGLHLTLDVNHRQGRRYRSAAVTSTDSFLHGKFKATLRPASGPGVVTGLFLHRSAPRQEIDIEFAGSQPTRMLTNVFFNPGDEHAASEFGYRGTPHWVDLGFDASADFHDYAIEWDPEHVQWLVDGVVVHRRGSWDPTPIPHLAMHLHANLWAPHSEAFAGRLDPTLLPRVTVIDNITVSQ